MGPDATLAVGTVQFSVLQPENIRDIAITSLSLQPLPSTWLHDHVILMAGHVIVQSAFLVSNCLLYFDLEFSFCF